jgi:hypothetical protein
MEVANQSKKWQEAPFPISSQVPLTTQPPFRSCYFSFEYLQVATIPKKSRMHYARIRGCRERI